MRPTTIYLLVLAGWFTACETTGTAEQATTAESDLPRHTYHEDQVFPGGGELLRAEDGVALENGNVIAVDQAHGLRLIEPDGSHRPFGDFASAGFLHQPPDILAGPNGVTLEPDGSHVLLADVFNGKLFRINIATEEVDLFYDHPVGVNTLYMDKTGAIWFTQSTNNTDMAELFRDVDLPAATGAVYRMADLDSEPVKMVDSLYFTNGIVMDESEQYLFVAETMMDRIHVFEVNTAEGSLGKRDICAYVIGPDNLTFDNEGRLVVALPILSQVVAIDLENKSTHIVFDGASPKGREISAEWTRRSHLNLPRLELLNQDMSDPLPGVLTGMFFSRDFNTIYITNLGNDLLKMEY
jgi:sugar lactone lactonase YvrE